MNLIEAVFIKETGGGGGGGDVPLPVELEMLRMLEYLRWVEEMT